MFCKPDRSNHDSVMPPPKTHIGAYLTGGLKDLYHRIIRGKVLQTPDDGAHTTEKGHFWPGHDGPVVLARRYHVTEVLNTRGQSAVLVFAEDLFNRNKAVVIKILHTTYFNIGAQEAECLRRLAVSDPHHVSHTVKLLNTFVFGGHFCMVFESLSPHPITEVFGDLRFPNCTHLHKVKKLSLQLLVVLGFLRQQNTIHADLKPENILLKHVNDLSSVTVIDFGNSIQHVHKEVSLYYREFDVQTLLYRAPEVMFGIPFGTEIDMWSLGCILAELYLGRPLFFGKTKPELLASITSVLGPLPKEVFQRGKYSRELASFTEDVEQEDATAKILECLEGSKDYAFANFLSQLFRYDPDERLSPSEAAQHPFLAQELCVSFLLPPSTKRPPSSILLNSKVYKHGVKISSEVKRQNPSTYDLLVMGTDRKIWDHGHHDTRVAEVQPYKQELDTGQPSEGQGQESSDMFLNTAVNRRDNQDQRIHTDFTHFSPSRKRYYEYEERNDSGFYERVDVKSEDSNDYAKRFARKPAFDMSKSLTSMSPKQVRGKKRSRSPKHVKSQTSERSPKHVRSQTRSRSPLNQRDRHNQNYSSFNTQTVKIVSGRSVVSSGTKHPDTAQCGSWLTRDLSPRSDRDKSHTDGRKERNSLQCPVKVLVKPDRSPAHSALREQESVWKLNQSHVSTRKTAEMSPQRSSCSTSKHISENFSNEDRKSHTVVTSQQLSRGFFAGQQPRDFEVEGTVGKTVKQSPGQLQKKMKRKQSEDDTWSKFTEEEKHDLGKKSEEETKYHPDKVKNRSGMKFEGETECLDRDGDGDDVSEEVKRCPVLAFPQFSKRKSSHDKYMMVTSGTLLEKEECTNTGHSKPSVNQDNFDSLRGQRSKEVNKSIMEIIMSPKSKISRFNVSPNKEDGDFSSHVILGPMSVANEGMKSDSYKYETTVQGKSDPALVQSRHPERRSSTKTPPVRVDEDLILSLRKSGTKSRSKMCPTGKAQTNMADFEKGDRRSLVENIYTEARRSCKQSDEALSGEEVKQMMAEMTVPTREKVRRKKGDLGRRDRRRLLKADVEVERSCELSGEELSGEESRQMMFKTTVPPRGKTKRNNVDLGQGDRRRLYYAEIDAVRSSEMSDEYSSGGRKKQMMFKTTVPSRGMSQRNTSDSRTRDRRRLLVENTDIEAARSCEMSDEDSSGENKNQMMFKKTVPSKDMTQRNTSDSRTRDRRRLLVENTDIEAARSCEMSDEDSSGGRKKQMMFKKTVPSKDMTQTYTSNSKARDRRRLLVENTDIEAARSCEMSDDSSGEKTQQMMFKKTVPSKDMTQRNTSDSRTRDRSRLLVENTDIEAARSCEMSDEDSSGGRKKQMMFKKTVPSKDMTQRNTSDSTTRDRRRLLVENTDIEAARSCEMSDDSSGEKTQQMMFKTTVPSNDMTQRKTNDSRTKDRRRLLVENTDIEAARSCEMSDEDSSGEKTQQMMFKTTVPSRDMTQRNTSDSRTRDRSRLLVENTDFEATRSCEMSDDLSGEDAKRMMMETTVECEAVAEFSHRKRAGVTNDIKEHSRHPSDDEQFRKIMGNRHVSAETRSIVKPADGERSCRNTDKKIHKKRMNRGPNQAKTLQGSFEEEEKTHEDERWQKIFEEHKHSIVKTSKDTELHQTGVERRKDMLQQFSIVDEDVEDMDAGTHERHSQREIGRYVTLDDDDQDEELHHSSDGEDEERQHSSDGEEVVMSVVDDDSVFEHNDASHSRQQRSDSEQVSSVPARKYAVKQTNVCISSCEKSNHLASKVKSSDYISPKIDDSSYAQRSSTVEKGPLICPVSQASCRRERIQRGRDFPNDTELEFCGNIHFSPFKRSSSSSQGTGLDKSKFCSGNVDKSEREEGSMSDSNSLGTASGYNLSRKTGQPSSETHNQMDENDLESDEYDSDDKHGLRTKVSCPDHNQLIDDDYKDVMEETNGRNSSLWAQSLSHPDKPFGLRERSDLCTSKRQMLLKPASASQEAEPAPARSEDMFNESLCGYEASAQDDSLVIRQPSKRRRKKSLAKRKLEFAKNKKMSFQDVVSNIVDNHQKGTNIRKKTDIKGTKGHVRKMMRGAKLIDAETGDHMSPCRKGGGKLNTSHISGSTKNPKSTLSSLKTKSLSKRASMQVKGKRKTSQDLLPEETQQGYHGEKRMRDGMKKSTKRYRKSDYRENIISNISNHSDSDDSHASDVSRVFVNKRRRTNLIRSKNQSRSDLGELSPLASKDVAEAESEQPALNIRLTKKVEGLKDSVKRFPILTKRSRKTKNSSPRPTTLDDSVIFLDHPDSVQSSHQVAGHKMVVKDVRPSATPRRKKKVQDADEDEILFLTA